MIVFGTKVLPLCYCNLHDILIMKLSSEEILYRLSFPLPGLGSHLKLAPEHRADELAAFTDENNARKSAVMILLFHENEKLKVIYIRRSFYVGIHAGQIAFPGGRYEEADGDVRITALREVEEEIGISPDKIEVLGRLTDIYVPPSNFLISTFVGYLAEKPHYTPDAREVAEVIEVDMDDFLAQDVIQEKEFLVPSAGKSVKALYYKVPNADIWGASAMVTSEFLDVLGLTQ